MCRKDCQCVIRLECVSCGKISQATMCSIKAGSKEEARDSLVKSLGWIDGKDVVLCTDCQFQWPYPWGIMG